MSETQQVKTNAREEIMALLEQLPEENVEALLRVLRESRPGGAIGRASSAIGTISNEDAEPTQQVTEEECGRADEDDRQAPSDRS